MAYVDSSDLAGTGATQGAAMVGFKQAGTGASDITVNDKLRMTLSASDFGLSSAASAADNLASLKAAVAAVPMGGTLVIPDDGDVYDIYTNGGLTSAVTVDKAINILLQGRLRMTSGGKQSNPPYLLNVTASDVSISGGGSLIGNGTFHDINEQPDSEFPGLLRIAADNCSITDIRFVSAPKLAVMLLGCFHASITACRFTGGPTVYNDTGYFGIRAVGGGWHLITGNHFYPDENGGMFVQCIFSSGSSDCIISGNNAERPYEKLLYWFGSRNTITNNKVVGNPETIPGTQHSGTVGVVFRVHGDHNKISENHTFQCGGGCSAINGAGNEISRNQFLECGAGGIAVFYEVEEGQDFSPVDLTTIKDNIVTYKETAGVFAGDGIYVGAPVDSSHVAIFGNAVSGFSVSDPLGQISNWAANTSYPKFSIVKPQQANGRYYVPKGHGGTSGASEPTWPTDLEAMVPDGNIIWTPVAYTTGIQAEIRVAGVNAEIRKATISDNDTSGGVRGISLSSVKNSTIGRNRIEASSWGLIESDGDSNRYERNFVEGTSNITVQGIAATSVFDTYRVGTWTPTPGAGLTVSGAFSSEGGYTVEGNWCHVWGSMGAANGIKAMPGASLKELTSNLPVPAAKPATGSTYNTNLVSPSTIVVIPTVHPKRLYTSTIDDAAFPNGVSTLIFSISYQV